MIRAIVPAAGKGTRSGLCIPKTLQLIDGKPILVRILHSLRDIDPEPAVIVSPSGRKPICDAIARYPLRAEIIDQPDQTAEVLETALREIQWVNRHLAGWQVLRSCLPQLLQPIPLEQPVRVLDLGTGSADLPLAMARWGRAHGRSLWITAVDISAPILDFARRGTAQAEFQVPPQVRRNARAVSLGMIAQHLGTRTRATARARTAAAFTPATMPERSRTSPSGLSPRLKSTGKSTSAIKSTDIRGAPRARSPLASCGLSAQPFKLTS